MKRHQAGWIGWLAVFLVTLGWVASEIEVSRSSAASRRLLDCWRRTQAGWQEANWLENDTPYGPPPLHPGMVCLLQLLLTTFALVAFPSRVERIGAAPGALLKRERAFVHPPATLAPPGRKAFGVGHPVTSDEVCQTGI